jgi:hypothetical protein
MVADNTICRQYGSAVTPLAQVCEFQIGVWRHREKARKSDRSLRFCDAAYVSGTTSIGDEVLQTHGMIIPDDRKPISFGFIQLDAADKKRRGA